MANDAVHTQLPIMVRRPRAVWPGLDRMDLHRKQIAGDGNCLFASLADQLYGHPEKHLDIRAAVIDHMRVYRPLFESFAIKDDIQQKRATRATTNAMKNVSEDTFEDYLSIMCKPGTYGGEPELTAFVQCYDQDVLVHLPRMEGYPEAIPYVNQHRRADTKIKPQLHLCYGGDEVTFPHYDSARRKTSTPSNSVLRDHKKASSPALDSSVETFVNGKVMTPRAIRNNRSELSRDLMHDIVTKANKDLRTTLDDTDRARSPSVSSSHHSSSSKRSFEDEGEMQRASKRADRRKSTRIRGTFEQAALSQPRNTKLVSTVNSQPATPQSTQSSDYSSDQSDNSVNLDVQLLQSTGSRSLVKATDELTQSQNMHQAVSVANVRDSSESIPQKIIAERQHSTLHA